ncbi:MAG TPA: GNAT family N-acetyltransferase [Solirubrobacterales bacterium]|nr:GNAT family N-acetyltransferase [Solirubrobacterales bacterium]
MGAEPELQTARLRLRRWIEADHEPFAALNADPAVMEYFPDPLTREQSDSLIEAIESGFEQRGFGLWAVEVRATGAFIGFTGLNEPSLEAHFTPAVEVGWRLVRAAWGEGYATEAARASLAFGFEEVGLDQVVSFTSAENMRSRAVMERVGMTRNPDDDFEHPGLPDGDPLRRHVLYRIGPVRAQRGTSVRLGRLDG